MLIGSYIKRYLLVIFSLGCLSMLPSTKNSEASHVSFGVKIGILPTGGLMQFAIFHYRNGRFSSKQPLSIHELFNIGTGKWPIPRTRTFRNFFEENGLLVESDEESEMPLSRIKAAIDSLWKIRFVEHPFDGSKGFGWSNGEARPSLAQQTYIVNTYAVRGYDQDYFEDTSFFKLLRDVTDTSWIANYKSLY